MNTWFFGAARKGEIENVEPTSEHASVKVSYRGRRWRRHRDEYVLDVSVIKEDTSITSSSSFKGRLKSIDESLKSGLDLDTYDEIHKGEPLIPGWQSGSAC